ncbi:MAG TPA: SCO family protein [Solirubrobacteraceae bacterium]|nr:SCO family protein [Solirubrobacteraceae bacterium]
MLALAGALVVGSSGFARADTDPASTYLVSNQVFLSSQPTAMSSTQRQLVAAVTAANRAGFAIRVAVISSNYDLGSVPKLWDKPRAYARFLGVELAGAYRRQRLLVVMPNGFGFNWPGHATAPTYGLLATVPLDSSAGAGLAGAAEVAVRRLARASGVSLPPSQAAAGGSTRRGSAGTLTIIGAGAGGIAALFAFAIVMTRARHRLALRRERRAVSRSSRLPRQLRWAMPGLVLLCGVAVAAPILAFGRSARTSTPTAYSPVSLVSPPAASWGPGDRRAPDFSLRDEDGRPVSVAANRGHPVIVTFVDPLCRNFCPLEAHVLNQMERQIPAARRPVILAVNVDVYANARRYLLQDDREWRLVPEWRWVIGRPADLAAVWKNYRIAVKVTTSRINGTVTYGIDHTEAAYVLDATGHERALFAWPFNPQDLEHVLRTLE